MGVIQHSWPWDSQPQEAVELEAGNALAAGADFFYLPSVGVWLGADVPQPSANVTSVVAGESGLGFDTTLSAFSQLRWSTPANAWLRQQTFTRTLLIDLAPSANGCIWNCEVRADIAAGSEAGVSAGVLAYKWYDGGAFRTLSTPSPVSGLMLVDVVSIQGVGHYLYINGGLVSSDSLTASTVYANARDSGIGRRDSPSAGLSAPMVVYFAINQRIALSANQIKARSENIWQLFAPRQIPIPTTAAAPAFPTITLPRAKAGSITSTGFVPQWTAG